ncbi:GtrA family protein [Caldimonas brevitalea]|uniref:GtrA family protein n=1 Tax=Caldimonas brevitalea TaxID=413882 RepID=UPI0009F81EAE|nr:GtrA family protein [Caldimonas brevitalea]
MAGNTYAQFLRFAVVGIIGFAVDAGILYVTLNIGFGPYIGRVISFVCAVIATWQINRRFTFTQRKPISLWREWQQYFLAMSLGGVCNYATYALALRLLPPDESAALLAVAAGSVAGMFVNFSSAKLWVFKPPSRTQNPQ